MKLQSGREVSNDLMNSFAENAIFTAFGCEDVQEGMEGVGESLESGHYEGIKDLTEAEIEEILAKIEPLVDKAYDKLSEFYDKLVEDNLIKNDW